MSSTVAVESAVARWVIAGLSLLVILAVCLVMYVVPGQAAQAGEPGRLPTINALLNGAATVFLIAGFVFVRRRNIAAHKRCMLTATAISSAFLVTYLLHHGQVGSVPFQGVGFIRTVYFSVLIPHILLAAVMVPMVLLTLYRGLGGRFELHRRIARWTLPIWLYVSVSGVVVYWMLYHLPV